MCAELYEHLVGSRTDMPSVTCCGEHTSGFELGECEVNDGIVSQQVIASHGDALDFQEAFPQEFNRVFWGPNGGDASTVAFKFSPCDGSIGGA